jgi:hypothetical protein
MSSIRQPIMKSFVAGEDLSSYQYCFVKWSGAQGAGALVVKAGANEKTVGILQNAPASGEVAEVALPGGGGLLKLGEASLSAGDLLTPTSGSTGEQCDAADEWCGAILQEDGTSNDVKEVLVSAFYSSKSDA